MHTVKRAVIMAAGFGNRMHPVTLETPKPLVRVNGVRMIDTVIRALHDNGVFEIHVVVGYKKEQFQELTQTYPGVQLIENPYFDTCNNIASLYVARDHARRSHDSGRRSDDLQSGRTGAGRSSDPATTAFGQKPQRTSGCKPSKTGSLPDAAERAASAAGSCTAFPGGQPKTDAG